MPDSGVPLEQAAHGVQREEAEASNSVAARALYKKRVPIYPKAVTGTFRRIKWIGLVAMLGVYYLLPWLRWDRGPNAPDQAVLVDFENARFYFFFIEIWPQEVYYITGLLILAAMGLFLVTALFGRVWCGYACPQTVWTDLYLAVERWLEGDRNARIKLDRHPWDAHKWRIKLSKHAIWLLIAAATGGAWILYFHDAPSLARDFFRGEAPLSAYAFFGILTFTTYSLAGTMREQVCTYMCPWPRIQAAMTDEDALQVTYRAWRGEPRGPHKKGEPWDGRGDCIDCRQCVAVCPMGIDIRDGAQLECINCALCIDACDSVMDKIERPRGLIAYDSDLNLVLEAQGKPRKLRFLRARTLLYGGVFTLVGLLMLVGLFNRAELEVNLLRDRNPAFVTLSDGSIRNGYTVKVENRGTTAEDFRIDFAGPDGLSLKAIGMQPDGTGLTLPVEGGKLRAQRIFVTLPEAAIERQLTPLTVTVTNTATGESQTLDTMFQAER